MHKSGNQKRSLNMLDCKSVRSINGKITRQAKKKRTRLSLGFQLIVYVEGMVTSSTWLSMPPPQVSLTQEGRRLVPHRPAKTWGHYPGSRPVLVAQVHAWGRFALYFRLQTAPPGIRSPTHTTPPTTPAPPIE